MRKLDPTAETWRLIHISAAPAAGLEYYRKPVRRLAGAAVRLYCAVPAGGSAAYGGKLVTADATEGIVGLLEPVNAEHVQVEGLGMERRLNKFI